MNQPWVWKVLGLVVFLAGMIGCNGDEQASDDGKYTIVATVGMVGDIARNVAGEHAHVTVLMGEGTDPHLYRATSDDAKALKNADVVFYNGLLLEGKMAELLEQAAGDKPTIAVAEVVSEDRLLGDDPHIWMDPQLWTAAIDAVEATLIAHDASNTDAYRANAEAYRAEVAALGEYGTRTLATIPTDRRIMITSHDAFQYFGRAFDLEVRGVQGLSTESEAGLQQVNALVDLIVEQQIQAVFVETSVPQKSIEALINGAKSRGHDVVIGGSLFSDAMGSASTYEGTYVGMLDHNITTVTRALGGEAPAEGLNGKLSQNGD
ncbi:MAG: zinc ABC transporter substrate-binding protein [Planctomycetota bacterium]